MERHFADKLIVPEDFIAPRSVQKTLVPPSHFMSSAQSMSGVHRGTLSQGTAPGSWMTPALAAATPIPHPSDPWLAITQAQQEILKLRNENQRIMMLQGDDSRGQNPTDHHITRSRSGERSEQWSRRDTEWRLEVEKYKAESERLTGQVEALKESAGRHRDEMRDKERTLNRQSLDMEAMRDELCKAKTQLDQIRLQLNQSREDRDKMVSQIERLEGEYAEETLRLKRDMEKSREEVERISLKAETARLQADNEAKQHNVQLTEQLVETRRKHEIELQELIDAHSTELESARQTNSDLQVRLNSVNSEVMQLKSSLMEVSAEREGLKENLSQMGETFETQSATLQSLRNYIGQLAPERGEQERLTEMVERLNKEKEALQMTTELLTVRLNSANEILALQEEKMVKTSMSDPLKTDSKGLRVLHLWRERVFMLCVQLRSKDIELRAEKNSLLSMIQSMEQQIRQEQYQASVIQHSLQDRIAELDLERVAKETVKQELAQVVKENFELKSQSQKADSDMNTMTEAFQRFRVEFEAKVAEVDAAQARLNMCTQRLTFAKRRVQTIQGLIMRKVALQKVQQSARMTEQTDESIRSLQAEVNSMCEERDNLTLELKRTPELIENAVADLREQFESKVRQQQQELEQSQAQHREAVLGREEAQQRLQHLQTQLEETNINLAQLRSELHSQQEHKEQALRETVSETQSRCAEQLREMEAQLNSARREHTKAVMTLRQFERHAARERDQEKEAQHLQSERTKRELEDLRKQVRQKDKDKNLLLAIIHERGLMNEYKKARTTVLQHSAALGEKAQPSEKSVVRTETQLHAKETLLSVLDDLQALSAAVVNSSEDSAEDEGHMDSVGPPVANPHS